MMKLPMKVVILMMYFILEEKPGISIKVKLKIINGEKICQKSYHMQNGN